MQAVDILYGDVIKTVENAIKSHGTVVVGVVCLLRGSVGLEYGLVSLGLHCFLWLARALCWRSGRCLVGAAFSV